MLNDNLDQIKWQSSIRSDQTLYCTNPLTFLPNSTFYWLMRSFHVKYKRPDALSLCAPTIEHHGGDARTPANQRWDQVPGRSQRLLALLAAPAMNACDTTKVYIWNICDGCSMLPGDAYSLGHLPPFHFGLSYVLLVETNLFSQTMLFEYSSVISRVCYFTTTVVVVVIYVVCGRKDGRDRHTDG